MSRKDALIADLRKLVEKQAKQIDALTQELDELKIQLAKANKNSSNSSQSSSSDITGAGKKKGKGKPGRPKKRTIGGQPGRDRKLREPLPPERVDETIELPDCPVLVTEHRFRLDEAVDGTVYYPHVPEVQKINRSSDHVCLLRLPG